MKAKLFCLAVALPLSAAPAVASTIQLTFTGIVTGGYDRNEFFGRPPGHLGLEFGDPISIVYTFNTSLGTAWFSDPSLSINTISGGSDYSTTSPSLGAVVTINGHSETIGGAKFGYLSGQIRPTGYGEFTAYTENFDPYGGIARVGVWLTTYAGPLPSSLTDLSLTPFSYSHPDGVFCNPRCEVYFQRAEVDVFFAPKAIDLVDLSPVPIPNVGAGLPGLIAAVSLLGWWRARRKGLRCE